MLENKFHLYHLWSTPSKFSFGHLEEVCSHWRQNTAGMSTWWDAHLRGNHRVSSAVLFPTSVCSVSLSPLFSFPGPLLMSVRNVRGLCWERGWAAEEVVWDRHYEQGLGLARNQSCGSGKGKNSWGCFWNFFHFFHFSNQQWLLQTLL